MKQVCLNRQRGVALIQALLIVALVTGLSVSFAARFERSVSQAESRWLGDQARAYLIGAEALGKFALHQDAEQDGDDMVDHLEEDWAFAQPPFTFDGGWLEAGLSDAQGRFNINSLAEKVSDSGSVTNEAERFTENQRRFIRLLQTFEELPLDQAQAIEITEAVIDWIDSDDEPTGYGGAESLYYSGLEVPYVAPNRLLVSVQELLRVKNMTPVLFRLLEPHIIALTTASEMNINTMNVTLLRTLNMATSLEPLSLIDAENLLQERQLGYFDTMEAFNENGVVAGLGTSSTPLVTDGLGVASQYFILTARAQVGEQQRQARSLLYRDSENDNQVTVLRRSDFGL